MVTQPGFLIKGAVPEIKNNKKTGYKSGFLIVVFLI